MCDCDKKSGLLKTRLYDLNRESRQLRTGVGDRDRKTRPLKTGFCLPWQGKCATQDYSP